MKRYELESLIKSFLLFFSLMAALYLSVAWLNYRERSRFMEEQLVNEMKLFSYRPVSNAFDVDFVPLKENADTVGRLYHDPKGVYALFPIPGSKKFLLQVSLPRARYEQRLDAIRSGLYRELYWVVPLLMFLALALALYSLYPLRKALKLNEEFVRDILHDINTPLSSLLINVKLLKKRWGEHRGFERMLNNIQTIQNLQANLRSFLKRDTRARKEFCLSQMLAERLEYFRILYPELTLKSTLEGPLRIVGNPEAMQRILDNLLSNACKYNKKGGSVTVRYQDGMLEISDTGIGIRHPERVFQRYYKEGERGIGLGLHIVKKLADEMGIGLKLRSRTGSGTRVTLDLKALLYGDGSQ